MQDSPIHQCISEDKLSFSQGASKPRSSTPNNHIKPSKKHNFVVAATNKPVNKRPKLSQIKIKETVETYLCRFDDLHQKEIKNNLRHSLIESINTDDTSDRKLKLTNNYSAEIDLNTVLSDLINSRTEEQAQLKSVHKSNVIDKAQAKGTKIPSLKSSSTSTINLSTKISDLRVQILQRK